MESEEAKKEQNVDLHLDSHFGQRWDEDRRNDVNFVKNFGLLSFMMSITTVFVVCKATDLHLGWMVFSVSLPSFVLCILPCCVIFHSQTGVEMFYWMKRIDRMILHYLTSGGRSCDGNTPKIKSFRFHCGIGKNSWIRKRLNPQVG